MCSIEDDGVIGSWSRLDFAVKRMGLADASVGPSLRMVAVLAFVMVTAAKTAEDAEAVLMKLSARSRRVGGSEDEAVESMLLEGVDAKRAPCSRRDATSCVGASAHLLLGEGRCAMLLATSNMCDWRQRMELNELDGLTEGRQGYGAKHRRKSNGHVGGRREGCRSVRF